MKSIFSRAVAPAVQYSNLMCMQSLTARFQPWRRIDRLPVAPQFDIQRRPVCQRWPGSQPGITPTGSPAATDLPDLVLEPFEAGQHGMVAAAAVRRSTTTRSCGTAPRTPPDRRTARRPGPPARRDRKFRSPGRRPSLRPRIGRLCRQPGRSADRAVAPHWRLVRRRRASAAAAGRAWPRFGRDASAVPPCGLGPFAFASAARCGFQSPNTPRNVSACAACAGGTFGQLRPLRFPPVAVPPGPAAICWSSAAASACCRASAAARRGASPAAPGSPRPACAWSLPQR